MRNKNTNIIGKDDAIHIGNSGDIKILVCSHKPYPLMKDDIFLPIQGGKKIASANLGIIGDDTGENISEKNPYYSELSVLYWAWKNLKIIYPNTEYVGLCHYRRYFAMDNIGEHKTVTSLPVMNGYEELILNELKDNQIILPINLVLPFTVKTQYEVCHHYKDWINMKQVIHELHPEYDNTFITALEESNKLFAWNMFITSWDIFSKYCQWFFPLLSEIERRSDISQYSDYQKRLVSFLSERLFTLYIVHNKLIASYKPIYFFQINTEEEKHHDKIHIRVVKIKTIFKLIFEIFLGERLLNKMNQIMKVK